MSSWKRKALALFPEFDKSLRDKRYNIYQLYFDLFPLTLEAHRAEDDGFLRRAYGFAEWCMAQKAAEELWNSAGTCFYENLAVESELWHSIAPWVSPSIVANVRDLWRWRLGQDKSLKFERLIEHHEKPRHQETVFATGAILSL